MARLQNCFIGGVLVLTVTVLLNIRPTNAQTDCTPTDTCKNGGTCPTDTKVTPCDCSASAYVGDTCADEVCTDGGTECKNGGSCDKTASPKVCKCGDYKGKTCADACEADTDCLNGGTCDKTGSNNVCSCGDYKGDMCADACEADTDCLNGGTCDKTGSNNVCSCGDYKGDMCADDCSDDNDCGTDGTCETTKKCTCKDSTKEGPGCKTDKSGASSVTSFSLMSLGVILTGYLL